MNQFLFSPTKQFVYPSGKILVGGKIYVFIKHTNTLATLFNDEGVEIANPVVLDSNGRATVLADENYDYKLDVYTSDDELLFTAASYMTDQYERDLAIISTDGSVDITPSVSGYTDVWDLSVSGAINEAISGKFDTSAFEDFYTNTYEPTINYLSGTIESISGAGSDSKLDVSAFTGYSAALDSNLSNAFETVHNDITGLQNDDSYLSGSIDYLSGVVTTGISAYSAGPNIKITDYVISGRDWLDTIQEASAYAAKNVFSGVITDSTFTGDGKNDPLGVNSSWFDNAVNSAYTGTTFTGVDIDSTLTGNGSTSSLGVNMLMINSVAAQISAAAVASAQSGLIRDIDFMLQNVTIYPDTMSGYNADGTVWLKYHWGCDGSTEASGGELENYFDGSIRTNYISMAPSAKDVFDTVRTNSSNWNEAYNTVNSNSGLWSAGDTEVNNVVHNNSATWNTVTDKLDTTSFSDVSGTFLTAHQPISADEWNDVYDTVNVYSGSWTGSESSPTASVDSYGSIDIVSSNNTVYFDVNNTWFNDAVNSALPTSSDQWNSNYETVNTNSGVWGGSALNISAGAGIQIQLINNVLVISTATA